MNFIYMHYGKHRVPEWSWKVDLHGHAGCTLWSVWAGSGRMTLGNTTYSLSNGDIFFINYEYTVDAAQNSGDMLDVRYIDFTPENPEELRDFPTHRHMERNLFMAELFNHFHAAEINQDRERMSLWLNALLSEYSLPKTQPEGPYTRQIEKICNMFHHAPDACYNITDIAQGCSLSPDHFIRVFKQEKNVTPYIYLQTIRLETAKGLLIMSNLSVTDIAAASGFSNIYNFCRFFREKTGKTPGEYRKTYL